MTPFGKILITTSRNPTPRMRTFCSDLSYAIPNIVRVNRGKMSIDEVAEKAIGRDADRVVIVDRWQGGRGGIKFFQLGGAGLVSIPPTIHVAGIRLRREFGVSKVKPALSLVSSASKTHGEMLRVAETLSKFFSIPILPMDEAVEAGPTLMCISREATNRIVITFIVEPGHVEVGPRIIVSRVEW